MSSKPAGGFDASALETRLKLRQQALSLRIRERLLASGEPLLVQMASSADSLCTCTVETADVLDVAARRELFELHDIEHALRRFQNATYGCCMQCAGPIEPARLNQHPEADWCLSCKTAFEMRRGITAAAVNTASGRAPSALQKEDRDASGAP